MSGSPSKAIVHMKARRTIRTMGSGSLYFSLIRSPKASKVLEADAARVLEGSSTDDHSRHRIITSLVGGCKYIPK